MENKKEIWKNYNELYKVSNMGRVLSLKTNKILKPVQQRKGSGYMSGEASRKTGISANCIWNVLHNRAKTAGGFVWCKGE